MRTPLAWFNLIHNRTRTLVAIAGVAFSVLLIFMQLGFLGAVENTATLIYDALRFDVAIRSREYLHMANARSFPIARLGQAESMAGVQRIAPFYIDLNQWRIPERPNPKKGDKRGSRGILVMGARPDRPVFALPELKDKAAQLARVDAALIDRKSRRDFGPRNRKVFSDEDIGVQTEVGQKRIHLAGHFALGTGLAADGAVLFNERGFCRLFPGRTPEQVSLGLIEIAPTENADDVAARLREIMPDDVEVLTREQVVDFELNRWIQETSIGSIFQLGVVVSLLVGMAIVYQVLSSDVANHLTEYATLKCLGYSNAYLAGVVLQQAVILAVVGFVPGLILAEILYRVTSYLANIPIEMNGSRLVFVLFLAIGMCAVSGFAALRKVRNAEPADLF